MSENDPAVPAHALPHRFLFNVNFVFIASLTSNTVGFSVAILLARALGPDGRGVAALYQAAVNIAFAFLNLGIAAAAFYYVTRAEMKGREAAEAGLTVSLGAAAVAGVGVIVTAVFFGDRFQDEHMPYWLAVVAVPAIIQFRLTLALLRSQGRFGAMNGVDLGLPISMLVCLGGVELLSGLTVANAVWAWSLAFVPPVIAGYAILGRDFWPRRLAAGAVLAKAIRFGLQGQLTTLIQLANYRLDVFMILIFVNTTGVGLYTVANSQSEGLWIVADSIAIVLLTNITAGDAANAARLTPVVCRNTLAITAVSALVAAIIAHLWIPAVFGEDYRGSVAPYVWLLPGTVAISGAKILGAYVFSRGRPIINAWISLVTLVATLPAEILLIHAFGVTGAAVGTSLGYILSLILTAWAYRYLSGRPIHEALILRRQDASIYLDGLRRLLRRSGAAARGLSADSQAESR